MEIPKVINERKYNSLNKKNLKMLHEEIETAKHDYDVCAYNLNLNLTCIPNLDISLCDGGFMETTKTYRVELNAAYRYFIKNRNKIYAAYLKGQPVIQYKGKN